ncbi:MAG: LysM peptidoglycan-binding domain-containing protein [Acidimicrobiales bacterium]|nr:LysM peptidoglycan-binding domain-containing protein [Acidimicrobiales bacterium]
MSRPIAVACKGLVALLALVGVLVGPPVALVRFAGNPLPASLPPWSDLTEALTRRGISDETVIGVLAILAWLIWTQVAVAVLVELVAHVRRLPAPSVPVLPGLQPLAGQMVAAVVLLAALTQPRTPLDIEGGLRLDTDSISLVTDGPSIDDEPPAEFSPASEPAPTETYVVKRHDSLWSIAEQVFGDGLRWREIRDLNVGVRQADGGAITSSSDVIHPGWELRVPRVEAPADRSVPAPTHTVERGEHLWQIAEDHLESSLEREVPDREIDPYWRAVIDDNRTTLADPDDPSLIFAGQVIDLPPVPGVEDPVADDGVPPPPAPTKPPAATVDPDPPATGEGRPDTRAPAESPSPASTAPPEPSTSGIPGEQAEIGNAEEDEVDVALLPGLLGVAGTGVAAAVALQFLRRRRDHQARAPVGAVVPGTPDELLNVHRAVAGRADVDASTEVAAAMSELARYAAVRSSAGRRPRIVQIGHDHIDVLPDTPGLFPPDPWRSQAAGEVWTRARPVEAPAIEESPTPLLVSIGCPEAGVELLYDLESAGLTVVSGPGDLVDDLARSVLLEVAHGLPEVEVIALGDVPNCEHDRVRTAERWDDVADEVLSWSRLSMDALRSQSMRSAFAARGSGRPVDGVVPLLVVLCEIPDDARFGELLETCAGGAAAAVLVLAETPALVGTNIHLSDAGASIPSLGLEFEPQRIGEDVGDEIEALVESADRPAVADEPSPDELDPEPAPTISAVSPNGHKYEDPDFDVLVRVLGQVDVEGGSRPLKPKQLAVLAFVATHPGCSPEQLEEALWPEPIETSRHRLHIALSQVRSALGADQLPNMDEAAGYRVADTVRTDLELFENRVAGAEGRPAAEAIEILRGALELVTGPPFTYRARGRQSFTWIDTEHWMSKTEALVVKAAWTMWNVCSEAGDCEGAIWAAHQGLLASPTNTELTNCLLRAHLARGDRSAAETVYRSHLRALDQLDLGDPEDSTIELWEREITQRSSVGR